MISRVSLLFLILGNLSEESEARCYSTICSRLTSRFPSYSTNLISSYPAKQSQGLSSNLVSSSSYPAATVSDLSSWSMSNTAPMTGASTTRFAPNLLQTTDDKQTEYEMDRQVAYGAAETIEESKIIRVPVVETRTVKIPKTKYRRERANVTKYEEVKEPYTVTEYKLMPVQRTLYRTKLVPKKETVTRKVPYTSYEEKEIKESKGYQLFRVKSTKNDKDGTTNRDTTRVGGTSSMTNSGIPVVQQACPTCVFACPAGCLPVHKARAIARRALYTRRQ